MKLPDDLAASAAFAKHFNQFSAVLEAAKIQGFTWDKTVYEFGEDPKAQVTLGISQHHSHITEIDTGKIDADYMNSRFAKYLKVLQSGDGPAKEATLADLHRSLRVASHSGQAYGSWRLKNGKVVRTKSNRRSPCWRWLRLALQQP
ncbi:hypothetical protein [Aquabacterium sp.]|uniref:hypothetical protein n=1 Tax=Aquabacterium sp. TaxID=1872578 RepID=UPI00248703D7|nr:hypothetical protein [Aquabacterium sp.]MDI1258600.1 hypothetical protein [Aquabacterium sp.]